MGTELIQVFSKDFWGLEIQAVDANDLYEFLWLNKGNYSRWINDVIKWQWQEGVDYILWILPNEESSFYTLNIDFAKSVAMMSNSEKWKKVREYFIQIERHYKLKNFVAVELYNDLQEQLKDYNNLKKQIALPQPKKLFTLSELCSELNVPVQIFQPFVFNKRGTVKSKFRNKWFYKITERVTSRWYIVKEIAWTESALAFFTGCIKYAQNYLFMKF